LYLPEPVYEALRKIAFEERLKIHDVVLEGIDLALRRRGYASIESLMAGKKQYMKAAMTGLPTGVSLRCLPPRLPGTLSRLRLVYSRAPFTVSENGASEFRVIMKPC
jgi:hypothetical protein